MSTRHTCCTDAPLAGCDDHPAAHGIRIDGRLVERGNRLAASFNVLTDGSASMNSRLPDHYW